MYGNIPRQRRIIEPPDTKPRPFGDQTDDSKSANILESMSRSQVFSCLLMFEFGGCKASPGRLTKLEVRLEK